MFQVVIINAQYVISSKPVYKSGHNYNKNLFSCIIIIFNQKNWYIAYKHNNLNKNLVQCSNQYITPNNHNYNFL